MARPPLRQRKTSKKEGFSAENRAFRIPIEKILPQATPYKDGFLIPESAFSKSGFLFLPKSKLDEIEKNDLALQQHPWYKQGSETEEGLYIPVSACVKNVKGSYIPESASGNHEIGWKYPGPPNINYGTQYFIQDAYLYSTYKSESHFLEKYKGTITIGLMLLLSLIFISSLKIFLSKDEPKPFEVNDRSRSAMEIILEDSIEELKEDFPSQEESTWFTFLSGIKSVSRENPNKPSVFLLLYTDDEKTANCMANKISLLGISYLSGKNFNPLTLYGPDLKSNVDFIEDPGNLLPAYQSKVKALKAMIVRELHEVPGRIAQMFHYFCDRESPAVNEAIYFFTLKNERPDMKSVQKAAERTLENLWNNTLEENLLAPLITRLTGNVIRIKPEYQIPSDC